MQNQMILINCRQPKQKQLINLFTQFLINFTKYFFTLYFNRIKYENNCFDFAEKYFYCSYI